MNKIITLISLISLLVVILFVNTQIFNFDSEDETEPFIPLPTAKVYRSVDKDGQIAFSNKPPNKESQHDVINVEVQNYLGPRNEPNPSLANKNVYTRGPNTTKSYKSTSRYKDKLDLKTLSSNCKSYRKSLSRDNNTRKKRDYWCGRLHRGK